MSPPAHAPCPPRTTVAIADDCPAMREGLARLVADECDLAVIGSAATGAELRTLVAHKPTPQVLVMDLMVTDGDALVLIEDLVRLAPEMRIVVFTNLPEEIYAIRALRAGVRGYVPKREAVATLFRAIREAAAGGLTVPTGLSGSIFAAPGSKPRAAGLAAFLTNRELQIFQLVGLALPTRVVAERLGISVKTVETHRENIKNKLALGTHAELVARAAQWVRENSGAA